MAFAQKGFSPQSTPKKEIADFLNMQLTVYQRYERGERELPLWAAIKLAKYYRVSLDYLVGIQT